MLFVLKAYVVNEVEATKAMGGRGHSWTKILHLWYFKTVKISPFFIWKSGDIYVTEGRLRLKCSKSKSTAHLEAQFASEYLSYCILIR